MEPDDDALDESAPATEATQSSDAIAQLAALEADCAAKEREHFTLKEQTSEAKKSYELAVLKLRQAVARLTTGDPEPLFAQADGDGDKWRQCGIDRLCLAASINAKLAEADVLTIGDLEDLRAGKGLRSIAGIGQATVDKIENAVIDWLSENRDAAALSEA